MSYNTSTIAAACSSPPVAPTFFIPLYIYPDWYDGPGYAWLQLVNAANANPTVSMIVTINPNSGPGTALNSDFTHGLADLNKAPNITVIGYTYTDYAARPISQVQADILAYRTWYPQVRGIMLDQMSNVSGNEPYYSQLTSFAKLNGMQLVYANPGTTTRQSYVGTVDIIQVTESNGSLPSLGTLPSLVFSGYSPSNFAMGVYSLASLPSQSYIWSASQYIRFLFFTDQSTYSILPSYLSTELGEFV